jgi:hypothetical protein
MPAIPSPMCTLDIYSIPRCDGGGSVPAAGRCCWVRRKRQDWSVRQRVPWWLRLIGSSINRAGGCVCPVVRGVRHTRRGTVAVASVWRGILMAWYPCHTGGAEWKDDQSGTQGESTWACVGGQSHGTPAGVSPVLALVSEPVGRGGPHNAVGASPACSLFNQPAARGSVAWSVETFNTSETRCNPWFRS